MQDKEAMQAAKAWKKLREMDQRDEDNLHVQREKFVFDLGFDAGLAAKNEWVPINGPEDLPEDGKQYLWQYRNLTGSFTVIYKPRQDTLAQWWVDEFLAWRECPPPYDEQNGGKDEVAN